MNETPGKIAFSIVPLRDEWVDDVVELHRAVMGYSLNALLGPRHLACVYRITARLPLACVCVATDGERVLGAVSATLDDEACAREVLKALPLARKLSMVAQLCCRPVCWRAALMARRTSRPVVVEGQRVRACLTSIIVAPAWHRCGIGRALVGAVDAFMRSSGVAIYRLDTRVTNTAARAFYLRCGFVTYARRGSDVIFIRKLD